MPQMCLTVRLLHKAPVLQMIAKQVSLETLWFEPKIALFITSCSPDHAGFKTHVCVSGALTAYNANG